mgnify:FL=1|jgi:hypothetical protein
MPSAPWKRLFAIAPLFPFAIALVVQANAGGDEPESLTPSARAIRAARERGGKTDDLADIRERPVFYRGESVTFTLQLGAQNATWNPYLTRFDKQRYQSWQGWADSQLLWHLENFEDPLPRLFAPRGKEAAVALSGAPRYARFEVTAIVRTLFLGEPWIEILTARPLELSLGEGTLLHASRALEFAAEDSHEAAVAQYMRALDAPMPRAMEERLRAELEESVKLSSPRSGSSGTED